MSGIFRMDLTKHGSRLTGLGCILAALLSLLLVLPVRAQGTLLTVTREHSLLGTFSLAKLEAVGAVTITLEDDAGQSSEYTGVPIADLLQAVGVPLAKSMRGDRLAEFMMIHAADGYRVLFSLAEVDPMFRERPLLICYRKNGAALPDEEGPLRVVVADEKRHARWVRQVTAIELGKIRQ